MGHVSHTCDGSYTYVKFRVEGSANGSPVSDQMSSAMLYLPSGMYGCSERKTYMSTCSPFEKRGELNLAGSLDA